jgi:hypothetical protein
MGAPQANACFFITHSQLIASLKRDALATLCPLYLR